MHEFLKYAPNCENCKYVERKVTGMKWEFLCKLRKLSLGTKSAMIKFWVCDEHAVEEFMVVDNQDDLIVVHVVSEKVGNEWIAQLVSPSIYSVEKTNVARLEEMRIEDGNGCECCGRIFADYVAEGKTEKQWRLCKFCFARGSDG